MRKTLVLAAVFASVLASASACTPGPDCEACGGTFDAAHCACACPLSKLEALAVGYAGFILLAVMLLS